MQEEGQERILYYCDQCLNKIYSETEINNYKLNKLIPYFHDN